MEKVKRYQPPNPTAIIFWLKNRKKDEWNDRREVFIDTKQNEEERKRLFLEMIDDDTSDTVLEGEFTEVDETSGVEAEYRLDVKEPNEQES